MKILLVGFMMMVSFSVVAGMDSDPIHTIVEGTNQDPHIIKFQSGKVELLDSAEKEKLALFQAKLASQPREVTQFGNLDLLLEGPEYEPTQVPDAELTSMFKRMNPFMRRKSECSDRAHVWAWDEFQKSGVKSEKAFLLLTDTYIKRHRYKWWFHVAPMYTTKSGKKMVMDFQFMDRPVTFTEWKNTLVFSKRECVRDFQFIDYNAGADQSQDCYVKFEPMYYYVPGDIGARELGRPRTGWNNSQVSASRARAFFTGSQQ